MRATRHSQAVPSLAAVTLARTSSVSLCHSLSYAPRSPNTQLNMEDVWGNAWSDPADSSRGSQTASSLWTSKPRSQLDDDEADIAMPSWATGTGINWDEPSDNPASLWSQGATSPGWSPANPYSSFAIGKSRSPEPSEPSQSSTARASDESQSSPVSPTSSAHDERSSSPSTIEEESQGVIPQPSSPIPSTPSSPDGFGGFETALAEKDTDAWNTPSESFKVDVDGANTWASAWAEPQTSTSTTGEQEAVDEWEAAKREKEAMDRRVVSLIDTRHTQASNIHDVITL